MLSKKSDLQTISRQKWPNPHHIHLPHRHPQNHGWLWDLAKNFMIGGAITASISYTANFLSPVAAAIWWAFPLSLLPSVYYLIERGRSSGYVSNFVLTTTYALVILFITTMALGYFYKGQKEVAFWPPVLKALVIYAVLGGMYYWFIKHFQLGSYFE